MGKLVLSGVALALLVACGGRQPAPVVVVPPAPVVSSPPPTTTVVTAPQAATTPAVVQSVPLRPGFGRIESMGQAPSASAGGTTPPTMWRLGIKMDDGSMQVVDTPSTGLAIGDRIELTREGFIRKYPS
jgi:hypothetical protein